MKNTHKIRYIVFGMVLSLILTNTMIPSFAAATTKTLNAVYSNIKIFVDGGLLTPKDALGKEVEPFTFEGTTYVPVSSIARALGKTVEWDAAANAIYIGEKPNSASFPAPWETTVFKDIILNPRDVKTHDITLKHNSHVVIGFEHEYRDNFFYGWKIQLVNKNSGLVYEFTSAQEDSYITSRDLYLPAGDYFVRVSDRQASRNQDMLGKYEYTVLFNTQKNTGEFEVEENGARETANRIEIGKPITGNILFDKGDNDYLKFNVSAKSNIYFDFSHAYIDSSNEYWQMKLIDSRGKELKTYSYRGNDMKTTTDVITLDQGEYYINIYTGKSYSSRPYTLTVNSK